MKKIESCIEILLRDGYILVFNQDKLDIVKTAEALQAAGIRNMEVTCRIQRPLEKIRRLRDTLPDFAIGAASLVDFPAVLGVYNQAHPNDPLPSVAQVVEAGVDYLVSAGNFSDETYEQFAGRMSLIPGCGTATEILDQYARGANLCKVFPAKQLGGPGFVKAVDPALHKIISLVPTGGTNADNIPDYIAAGVLVVGGSFSMVEKETMQRILSEQDYDLLAEEFKKIKHLIDTLRSRQWPDLNFSQATPNDISRATGRCFNL